MDIEEIKNKFYNYISQNEYFQAYSIFIMEFIKQSSENTENPEKSELLAELLEEINEYLLEIYEQLKKQMIIFAESIAEYISVYDEVLPCMKKKDRNEFDKILEEQKAFFDKNIKLLNENATISILFLFRFYLENYIPILTYWLKITLIFDKYYEYLPIEKMPKTFSQEIQSKQNTELDIADDLLFIDDID